MKTVTKWKSHHVFESIQEHHKITLDSSKKHGFSPKALLLAGLGGCTGVDVVDILQKMRVDFSGLEVETETEQTEEHPRVFKEIRITYRVHTDPKNKARVKKAIDLSLEKYCGVSAMLRKNSPIHYTLVIG